MLRTSGDVSVINGVINCPPKYAPHERRCFLENLALSTSTGICSARAEMFLTYCGHLQEMKDMLRTSGDVSYWYAYKEWGTKYAPHERRCFS